jgi:hypothetical protein
MMVKNVDLPLVPLRLLFQGEGEVFGSNAFTVLFATRRKAGMVRPFVVPKRVPGQLSCFHAHAAWYTASAPQALQ